MREELEIALEPRFPGQPWADLTILCLLAWVVAWLLERRDPERARAARKKWGWA